MTFKTPRSLAALVFAVAIAMVMMRGAATRLDAQGRVSTPGEYAGYASQQYDGHERSSFYVTARDGTKLAVDLFRPTSHGVVAAEKLPVVWMHTPYNRRSYRNGEAAAVYPGFALQLVPYGYNVAVADFRGVYASFGQNRAYNRGEWLDAARFDAYDISEWFAKQAWSNGQVGMWGCSGTGGSQMQAATAAPASLKAIMPMSAEFDAYTFQVNGGVAPPPGAPLRALPGPSVRDRSAAKVDDPDATAQLQAATSGHIPDGDSLGDVPFRDSVSKTTGLTWWIKSSPSNYLEAIKKSGVSIYAVANWDEAGTKTGAFLTLRNLGRQAKLLVGPAPHCGWAQVKNDTGFDIVTEELRFFDYWLKGVKNGVMDEPPVTYYTYNAPPSQAWRRSATWPPASAVRTTFYLGEGTLTPGKPSAAGRDSVGFNRLAETATSTTAPKETAGANTLFYQLPLTSDMEVTGHPSVRLWMAATSADADIVARLDDVAPDGGVTSYNMHGQFRASRRALAPAPYDNAGLPWHSHQAADAKLLAPGEAVEIEFEMLPMSYIFKAGHQLRLTLFFADSAAPTAPDLQAKISVLRGGERASSVTLPVVASEAGVQQAVTAPALPAARPPLLFKEEWKQPPYTGALNDENRRVTQAALTNPGLELKLYGPDADEIGVYNHEGRFDVWNGMSTSPIAVTLRDKANYIDLTGLARLRWMVRTGSLHVVYPVVKLADGTLLAGDHMVSTGGEYMQSEVAFGTLRWFKLDPQKVVTTVEVKNPDLRKVDEIGWADLMPGGGHGVAGWVNVSGVEVYARAVAR